MMIRYEQRSIASLVLDEANPRKISKAAKKALATSVKRFGLVQPVIINERTGRVVGGHQRIVALKEQGESKIDVAIGSWTEEEERALNVALNNPSAQGEFTDGLRDYLKDSLRGLSLDDFTALRFDDLVMTGGQSRERERREARMLEYKLVITARDEMHQAELLERFESDGLDVKLMIV